MLRGRKILLGITGSIAAYKAAILVRSLVREGAEVRVVMTALAKEFITPLTLATLSRNPILVDFFDPEDGRWNSHISLGEWADAFVVAPATANTMAKMAAGVADNLLLTTYLSARCPVFAAPAMDLDMYAHPATQANIEILRTRGVGIIEPGEGELASGLTGKGRMAEPEEILGYISGYFGDVMSTCCESGGDKTGETSEVGETCGVGEDCEARGVRETHVSREACGTCAASLAGCKIVVTAGPTREAIDPVRYISNHSTGKMGYAIAGELAARGAEVILISGPTELPTPEGVRRVDVTSAQQMADATVAAFEGKEGKEAGMNGGNDSGKGVDRNGDRNGYKSGGKNGAGRKADAAIMCAAVADYTPANPASSKIKKTSGATKANLKVDLKPTLDIAAMLGTLKGDRLLVGFALETDNELENAKAKLVRKNLDIIVLNSLREAGAGFGVDTNKVTIIDSSSEVVQHPLMSKKEVASLLADMVAQRLCFPCRSAEF